jgi:hypothetical protein
LPDKNAGRFARFGGAACARTGISVKFQAFSNV